MSRFANPKATKPSIREARHDRKGVVACITQKERAAKSDELRAAGFTRFFFFQTLGGFYCVEPLNANELRSNVPDDQAGE
jgi:hypothetical protein